MILDTALNPILRWKSFLSKFGKQEPTRMIGVTASFVAEPLAPHLGTALIDSGVKNPSIRFAPFGQIIQTLANPAAALGGQTPDALVILWRIEDLVSDPFGDTDRLDDAISQLLNALRAARKAHAMPIIVSVPPQPQLPNLTSREESLWNRRVEQIRQDFAGINGLELIDLDNLVHRIGTNAAFDNRGFMMFRQPWSEPFWALVGQDLARHLVLPLPKKLLIVDADNTLWGGVIGEDGLGGIVLSDDYPGRVYREFQKVLKRLKEQGVILALASKNNPADIDAVFETHDAMILRKEDFAAMQVGWNPKSEMIAAITAQMHLTPDSAVFIDDSAAECAEVSASLPGVTVIRLPEELPDIPFVLDRRNLFPVTALTLEDRTRTAMLQAEEARENAETGLSRDEFLKSLDLHMTFTPLHEIQMARAVQLIGKTNQFNLTTIRRSESELRALMADGRHLVFTMSLTDKFGDYGLVGLAILERDNGTTFNIDTLLMSCRALGRGAESAFLKCLAYGASQNGAKAVSGRFIPTDKNAPAATLYADHGFVYDEASGLWSSPLDPLLNLHSPVTLDIRSE